MSITHHIKKVGAAALCSVSLMVLGNAAAASDTGPVPVPVPERALLGLSKVDHSLSVIDPKTLKVLAKVPTGADPHELVSPDGVTAYVSNYGGGGGGYPKTLLSEIDIIDIRQQKVIANFDTAPLLGPHGLSFVNGKLYFTAQASKAIARYNPELKKVDWVLGTGETFTHFIKVSPDEKTIVTTNVDPGPGSDTGSISVFQYTTDHPPHYLPVNLKPSDTGPDWVQKVIPLGVGVEGLDVSPDFSEAWSADLKGVIHVVDIKKGIEAAKIETGVKGLHRLAFADHGKYVAIVSILANDGTPGNDAPEKLGHLQVWNAAEKKLVGETMIGCQGAGMLADDVDHRLFVSCTPQNIVRVVNLDPATGKPTVAADLNVGDRPDALTFAAH